MGSSLKAQTPVNPASSELRRKALTIRLSQAVNHLLGKFASYDDEPAIDGVMEFVPLNSEPSIHEAEHVCRRGSREFLDKMLNVKSVDNMAVVVGETRLGENDSEDETDEDKPQITDIHITSPFAHIHIYFELPYYCDEGYDAFIAVHAYIGDDDEALQKFALDRFREFDVAFNRLFREQGRIHDAGADHGPANPGKHRKAESEDRAQSRSGKSRHPLSARSPSR